MVYQYDKSWLNFKDFLEEYGKDSKDSFVELDRRKGEEFEQKKPLFYFICILILIICAVAIKDGEDWESYCWGIVPVFLLLNIACYYYVFLIMFFILWYEKRICNLNTVYLALLVAIQILGYIFIDVYDDFWLRIFHSMSLLILICILFITTAEIYRKKMVQKATPGRL